MTRASRDETRENEATTGRRESGKLGTDRPRYAASREVRPALVALPFHASRSSDRPRGFHHPATSALNLGFSRSEAKSGSITARATVKRRRLAAAASRKSIAFSFSPRR